MIQSITNHIKHLFTTLLTPEVNATVSKLQKFQHLEIYKVWDLTDSVTWDPPQVLIFLSLMSHQIQFHAVQLLCKSTM